MIFVENINFKARCSRLIWQAYFRRWFWSVFQHLSLCVLEKRCLFSQG
ncbi:hypothetical protein CWATWH0402_2521 [Crocosphaera watsonii WH 0402]|uniref:Uncharacterized protein n=2 Tax=Crocosphaera watsonii TaxID=263511 RepID=T2JW80_CROWT|nr:hypothetical protein CWATWH0003_0623 [Crocosphaera watsonii WH 0003]CCQ70073.1 hypothetical protein CWATWH0402_2521 [Crocosphaera watsonii WH 0402]